MEIDAVCLYIHLFRVLLNIFLFIDYLLIGVSFLLAFFFILIGNFSPNVATPRLKHVEDYCLNVR